VSALLQSLANAFSGVTWELSASRRFFVDTRAGIPEKLELMRIS
jgi:hypothetical protein